MTAVDNHRIHTGSDFAYFSEMLCNPGILPKLPLHLYGPLNIQYSVIEGTTAEKAARFAEIAADLRTIAENQSLKYAEETTSLTSPDKHHRAVLIMPQGKVMYTVVWIERVVKVIDDAE